MAEETTETSNGNFGKAKPGVAHIKPEYLDLERKKTVTASLLTQKALEEIKHVEDARSQDHVDGPPRKKAKLKGNNKNRPREQRPEGKERLCSNIVAEIDCPWGDKCKYQHDVAEYMRTKPADLGPECYVFKTYGKCPYGVACRYGKSHISAEYKNIEVDTGKKLSDTYHNVLPKDLVYTLRKKKYDFTKADSFVKTLNQGKSNKNKSQKSGKNNDIIRDCSQEGESTKYNCESNLQLADGANAQEISVDGSDCDNHGTGKHSTNDNAPVTQNCDTKHCHSSEIPSLPGDITGALTDEGQIRLRESEKKHINFSDKLYLAPLTTVGNLPFRRICKEYGADITCGEMALSTNILQGQSSEWALLKRHETEDLFGVQLCGGFPDTMSRCAQLLTETINIDFIDINCGCPIDMIFKRGEGSALMGRTNRFANVVKGMKAVMDIPLTVKMRTGIYEDKKIAHTIIPMLKDCGVSLVTLHGRTREQRYTKLADWDYIAECAKVAGPMPLFGNGDILSYEDANLHKEATGVSGIMIARGALIKPWIFTEIKEQRHWDISASERLDMLKEFTNYGLTHWGSDTQGIQTTRKFLLEWLSFLHRYIPVGLLERVPQKINERPSRYFGRNDLETLFASPNSADWVKISEMLLGPVSEGFTFLPKHKANAYQ